jgi:lysozyme
MGEFDANHLGPPASRAPRGPFVFPADADSDVLYGIDISHWTKEVPWSGLKGARVNYVYIKASQSARARDGMFEAHWASAKHHGVPRGAYHWLTPGVPGTQQGEYFVSRLRAGGGLAKGDMQPVIDLEWDFLGKEFRRTPVGGGRFKDYWSDHSATAIATEVNACVAAVKKGFPGLALRPIIYTNRSWWDERLTPSTRFDAPVWLADYRQKSYEQQIPRLIAGHDYNLWQFTEKGSILVAGKRFGPFDCNKIIKGDLTKLIIV